MAAAQDGNTALMLAIQQFGATDEANELVTLLISKMEERKQSLHAVNKNRASALTLAIAAQNEHFVRQIVRADPMFSPAIVANTLRSHEYMADVVVAGGSYRAARASLTLHAALLDVMPPDAGDWAVVHVSAWMSSKVRSPAAGGADARVGAAVPAGRGGAAEREPRRLGAAGRQRLHRLAAAPGPVHGT